MRNNPGLHFSGAESENGTIKEIPGQGKLVFEIFDSLTFYSLRLSQFSQFYIVIGTMDLQLMKHVKPLSTTLLIIIDF